MSELIEIREFDTIDIDLTNVTTVTFPVSNEEVVIEPKTVEQVITPSSPELMISKAIIKAVTKNIDENIKPENIRLGTRILGVDGNIAPDKPDQTKTTIPTKERQVVRADIGYELAENIVEPIPDNFAEVDEVTAEASDVLLGKTFVNNVGELKTGEIETFSGNTIITPNKTEQFVETGNKYVGADIVVEPIPDEYVVPVGELLIDENNKTYDVKGYETAKVEIAEKPKGEFFVKVFDYDGEQIGDTVWLNNGDTFTVPTAPPEKDRLIFDEWVCTQDIVDGVVTIDGNNVLIGATYRTKSGLTEIDIELTPDIAPNIETDGFVVELKVNGVKYWDLINDPTLKDTQDSARSHTYYSYGKYTIAFEYQSFSNNFGTSSKPNKYIKHARLNLTRLGTSIFQYCYGLETETMPAGTTETMPDRFFSDCRSLKCVISKKGSYGTTSYCYALKTAIYQNIKDGSNLCQYCYKLEDFVVPKTNNSIPSSLLDQSFLKGTLYIPYGITSIGDNLLNSGYFMEKVIFPPTLSSVGTNTLNYCYGLKEVIGFENTSITEVPRNMFAYCRQLEKIHFPATITSIDTYAIDYCFNIKLLDFSRANQVPALTSATMRNITDFKIVVPDALYDEWIVATNWIDHAGYIFKASEVQL